jgi:uncharacterized protein Yka (UPF0111/DUF47 family)
LAQENYFENLQSKIIEIIKSNTPAINNLNDAFSSPDSLIENVIDEENKGDIQEVKINKHLKSIFFPKTNKVNSVIN